MINYKTFKNYVTIFGSIASIMALLLIFIPIDFNKPQLKLKSQIIEDVMLPRVFTLFTITSDYRNILKKDENYKIAQKEYDVFMENIYNNDDSLSKLTIIKLNIYNNGEKIIKNATLINKTINNGLYIFNCGNITNYGIFNKQVNIGDIKPSETHSVYIWSHSHRLIENGLYYMRLKYDNGSKYFKERAFLDKLFEYNPDFDDKPKYNYIYIAKLLIAYIGLAVIIYYLIKRLNKIKTL